MQNYIKRNSHYVGSNGRKSLYDLTIPANFNGNLVIFVHGYMGFKDWGAWNLMQDYFVEKRFGFLKFNMSHYGGTIQNGIDFPDLTAFSENTYSRECFDLQQIILLAENYIPQSAKIHLIGHSRGGGIVLLNAGNPKVKSIVTLAAISSIEKRFSDDKMLAEWKRDGVRYVTNQRTKQQMPHLYAQVEDFLLNRESLSIEKACKKLDKPLLIIHGDKDVSVPILEGQEIASWTGQKLCLINDADHVFGASQPWTSKNLPEKLLEVCQLIVDFLMNDTKNGK